MSCWSLKKWIIISNFEQTLQAVPLLATPKKSLCVYTRGIMMGCLLQGTVKDAKYIPRNKCEQCNTVFMASSIKLLNSLWCCLVSVSILRREAKHRSCSMSGIFYDKIIKNLKQFSEPRLDLTMGHYFWEEMKEFFMFHLKFLPNSGLENSWQQLESKTKLYLKVFRNFFLLWTYNSFSIRCH